MNLASTPHFKDSIATKLFISVFWGYSLLAIVLTTVELAIHYQSFKQEVFQEFENTFHLVKPQLVDAIGQSESSQLDQLLERLETLKNVSGVTLLLEPLNERLSLGEVLSDEGVPVLATLDGGVTQLPTDQWVPNHLFWQRFLIDDPQSHNAAGTLFLYVSLQQLLQHLQLLALWALLSGLLKSCVLTAAFLFVGGLILKRPLSRLRSDMQQLTWDNLERLQPKRPHLITHEVHQLQNEFCDVIQRLIGSRRSVEDHLHQLTDANRRLRNLIDYGRTIVSAGDQFTAMVRGCNAILSEAWLLQSATVTFYFKEKSANDDSHFASFQFPVDHHSQSKAVLKLGNLDQMMHSSSNVVSDSVKQLEMNGDVVDGCQLVDHVLSLPLWNNGHLLGLIEIYGVDPTMFKKEVRRFIDGLSPFLSLSLGGAGNLMEIEKQVSERNRDLHETIQQLTQDKHQLSQQLDELQTEHTEEHQQEKLQSLGDMAQGTTDKLNQPLAIIHMNAEEGLECLQEENYERAAEALESITEQANYTTAIIYHLQKFAETTQQQYFENVNLEMVLQESLNLMRPQLDLHQIVVVEKYDTPLPTIKGQPLQIGQVLRHLIANAQEAMVHSKDRQLYIRALTEGDHVVIEIEDSGTGIEEPHIPHVLDPFFSTKSSNTHNGLGLSISYGIIQAHQGDLSIKSTPDHGSIFRVLLPCNPENS